MKIDKNKVDVSAVFVIYMTLVGDVNRTALALNMDPKFVEELAEQEGWPEKIRRVCVASKSGEPGSWERIQNRALNFAQAHRLRELIDRMIINYAEHTPEEFVKELATLNKQGVPHASARFLTDLATAAEKVQNLSYHALGDTVTERSTRDNDKEEQSAAMLHATILTALNSADTHTATGQDLVRKATEQLIAETERKSLGAGSEAKNAL